MHKWIVKGQEKEEAPEAFEDRVARVVAEQGIDPGQWTDEELENWKTISPIWEIVQAARMEKNRREREANPEEYRTGYSGLWVK